jgi:hypothetical protein
VSGPLNPYPSSPMKTFLTFLVAAVLAGAAGFFLGRSPGKPLAAGETAGRKPLFYQSPMHPWVTSDKPGNCTIWPVACDANSVAVPCTGSESPSRLQAAARATASRIFV